MQPLSQTTFPSWLERKPVRLLVLLVFLGALTVRIGTLTLARREYVDSLKHQVEVRNVALMLARTGDFADPYGVPTGKTAHLAPVAPFLTSLIYRIWGITDRAEFFRGLFCAMISSVVCGLTVLFGLAIGLGRIAAFYGGVITALAPHGVQFSSDLTELDGCLGTALFLGAVLTMLHAARHGSSPWHLALSGGLAGLTVLTHNALLAPLALWLACSILHFARNPLRLPVKSVIWMTLLMALVVLPWSVRNLLVFKQWVTVRSNFGLEFRIAHHDLSPFPATGAVHPFHSAATRALIRQVGEPAAFAMLGKDGIDWVRRHPAEFALRTVKRVVHFWIPAGSPIRSGASVVLALAAFCGFLLLLVQKHPAVLVIAILWIAYPAVYYVLQPLPRYQQPIGFSLYLMVGVLIANLLARVAVRKQAVGMVGECARV